MGKQRMIVAFVVCFSMAVLTGQTLSQMPPRPPRSRPGMTAEEMRKQTEEWLAQLRQEKLEAQQKVLDSMTRETWRAIKQMVGITEEQWKVIEPKYEKACALVHESRLCACSSGIERRRNEESISWVKYSEGFGNWVKPKTIEEMTEGERIVDDLIDLLRDKNSKDDQIRQKIIALQLAREKARRQLPKAREELRAVLTTPQQETLFMLFGALD